MTPLSLAVVVLFFAALCAGQTPPSDLKALVRDSLSFMDHTSDKSAEYSWVVRHSRRQLDAEGRVRSEETTLSARTMQEGHFVTRLSERNGQKLSSDETRQQEERIRKRLNEMKSPGEREKNRKKAVESAGWVKEASAGLDFVYVGEEIIDGRNTVILKFSPHPGFSASSMRTKILEKLTGKLWIDKTDRELLKAEVETFDTVNMGMGILGRLEKGTRFGIHRVKLPDGNWVVDAQKAHFAARLMLVKWVRNEIDTTMYDFRHKSQLAAAR